MNAIRGAQIRSGAKQAVREAEQEMHEERLDMINVRIEAAEKVLYDEEDLRRYVEEFYPDEVGPRVDDSGVYGIGAEQGFTFELRLKHEVSLSDHPVDRERKLVLLDARYGVEHRDPEEWQELYGVFSRYPIATQLRQPSLPLVRVSHDDPPIYRGLVEEMQDEEFQDFHSGVGVDGLDRQTDYNPFYDRSDYIDSFDWMFNPADYLD